MDKIIGGVTAAKEVLDVLSKKIAHIKQKNNLSPCLKVVMAGDNPASAVYVKNKQKKADTLGIKAETINLKSSVTQTELISEIKDLNNDPSVNGILVQLPLPKHIDPTSVIDAIDPKKDVDCFTKQNFGNLILKKDTALKPCTPAGCIYLVKKALGNDLSGLDAVVIGRSNIVGKPMSALLLHENCTVTTVHSETKDITEKTRRADIVVAAVGIPQFLKGKHIKYGATVIDVGINRMDNKIVGDVEFKSAEQKAKFITPVPKGVGPMTIAFLMVNTVTAFCIQNNVDFSDIII